MQKLDPSSYNFKNMLKIQCNKESALTTFFHILKYINSITRR